MIKIFRFIKPFISISVIFAILYVFLLIVYIQRATSFGCFDDCNNFMGGYFLAEGRHIFSEFFFNHMPGMAYISFLIQEITNPKTIYRLILYHRLALFVFSFFMGALITFRFRWVGLIFLFIFETTKFYIFGDRFLAENFIVYPLLYMFGVVLLKLSKHKLSGYDYILSGLFTWFIVFMREPYIPLAIFLYFLILVGTRNKQKTYSLILFLSFSLLTIVMFPLKEFIENVFIYNQGITTSEISEKGNIFKFLFTILFYYIYLFFAGKQTLLKLIFEGLSVTTIAIFIKLLLGHRFKVAIVVILILGIANIRFTEPGKMYFDAFHMVIWYALTILTAVFLIKSLHVKTKTTALLSIPVIAVVLYSFVSPESYLKNIPDKTIEFNNGYANYYAYGGTVKLLSNPGDTLFLEGTDDLIYFVADIQPSYRYGWYTSLMPYVDKYRQARTDMFENNPPDFYYDACKLLRPNDFSEQFNKKINKSYSRLILNGNKSCLMVRKDKLPTISKEDWESVKPLGFSLMRTLDSSQ